MPPERIRVREEGSEVCVSLFLFFFNEQVIVWSHYYIIKAAPIPDLEVGTSLDSTVGEVQYTDEQLVQLRMDQTPVRVMLEKELNVQNH